MSERDEVDMDGVQKEQDAPEASQIIRGEDAEQEEEEERAEEQSAPAGATPQPRPQQQQAGPKQPTPLRPYRPLSRFAHPFYWGNVLLFGAGYAAFRAQWLSRAAAHQQARAAAAAGAAAAATSPATTAPTTTTFIPYSRALTRPSDLAGWERQILFTFAAIALFKTLLKRRSWDAAAAHLLFYGRTLLAVVLFYCDWRWLLLHALACWFSYAAMAQPVLDLDALASARIEEAAAAKAKAGGAAAAAATTAPSPSPGGGAVALSGFSLPMNPPRLRELVLVGASAAEAAAAEAAALVSGASAKKAAKLLREHQKQQQKQQKLLQQQQEQQEQQEHEEQPDGSSAPAGAALASASVAAASAGPLAAVGSADYWVLLIGCLSGGHHADSAAYAPAHAHLAHRYRDGGPAAPAAPAAPAPPRATTTPTPRPRLRFAHLDASLFGAYCAATPALALPPAQQLAWSSAVPCVLLVDGRTGKELARLPARAQADDPFRRNQFTAADVERAFDLPGIAAGRVPKVAAAEGEGDEAGGGRGAKAAAAGRGGAKKKQSKDA
jgi:hypothetical protein